VVDDFGVKYVGKEHADHLISCLKTESYKLTEDWARDLYCGISLRWNYAKRWLDISMPGYIKGVEYAIRVKSYNLIFQMVIPFLTQPPHERTLTGRGSRVYTNVGAAGCTLTSGQPGAAWSGQEVCSGFALAARASPLAACCMNSYYTIRIKKCMNWFKNHTVYEFVLYNLYNNCMNSFV
jgi:hypothetical protein